MVDSHPNKKAHKIIAEKIITSIRSLPGENRSIENTLQ